MIITLDEIVSLYLTAMIIAFGLALFIHDKVSEE